MSRGHGPRSIAASVAKLTKPFFARRGFADGAIVGDWAAIIGPDLAAHSMPEKIVFAPSSRDNGTLHLRIDSGSFAVELQHLEPVLIERINAYFGYRAVSRVRISQGPAYPRLGAAGKNVNVRLPERRELGPDEEKKLAAQLVGIDDPELRKALESIGRSLAIRESKEA